MSENGFPNAPNPFSSSSSSSLPIWIPHHDRIQMMLPAAADEEDRDCFMMTSDHHRRRDDEMAPTSSEWSVPSADVASSSKSHSQAEKRRRDRINAQLARLRNLIPRSEKMDKAALLGSSVDHVKELKKKALEVSKGVTVPSEIDEVVIEECFGSPEQSTLMIKATLCCEDRPELFKDLIRTLKGLKLMAVGADMACLGGRVKTILILSATEGNVGALKQPLKAALSRIASFCNTSSTGFRLTSRRQRMLFPS
ncbi:hypothetical protein V2J09_003484 [Rumex salicifolius]